MVREQIQTDTDILIARYIAPYPGTSGIDEYWLPAFGYPVWVIAADHLAGIPSDVTAREFGMPPEAVQAAIAFYERHRARIDARLAQNRGE